MNTSIQRTSVGALWNGETGHLKDGSVFQVRLQLHKSARAQ